MRETMYTIGIHDQRIMNFNVLYMITHEDYKEKSRWIHRKV